MIQKFITDNQQKYPGIKPDSDIEKFTTLVFNQIDKVVNRAVEVTRQVADRVQTVVNKQAEKLGFGSGDNALMF